MWKTFLNGILDENPILMLLIGLCPVLACSSTAMDALGMGVAATFVLMCSNILVSSFRKFLPNQIRIPVFIVIIATFVTITDYTMQAFLPALSESLGVFVPLIVVNCMILGRSEAFAYKNSIWLSIWDALGMGLGFTIGIVMLGMLREFFGNGTIFGSSVILSKPAILMILPPGAYIGFGVLIILWKKVVGSARGKAVDARACASCGMANLCHPAGDNKCEILEELEDKEN